jgi:uncharacterized membrane protein YoaT (DUF817 family)
VLSSALNTDILKDNLLRFITFGVQQALSCLFPGLVFAMLAVSHMFAGIIPRYDFMLLACVIIQLILFYTKVETLDEIFVICVFHLLAWRWNCLK